MPEEEWTVAFDAMGGEGTLEPCSFPLDTTVSLPACTFTKDGYVFAGWSLKPNGGKEWADQESVSRDKAETVNAYAIWLRPDCYGIAFDPGVENAEWSMDYQSVAIGRVEKLSPCSLSVPAGKRFAGWRRKDDGRRHDDGVMVFNLADNPGDVVIFTAIWE